MSNIQENLQKILSAVWGRDVRQAIHDAIHDCYEDGSAGDLDLIAREGVERLETQKASKTELQTETTNRTAEVAVERGRVDSITETLSDVGDEVDTLSGDMTQAQTDITALQNKNIWRKFNPQQGNVSIDVTPYRELCVMVKVFNNSYTACIPFFIPVDGDIFPINTYNLICNSWMAVSDGYIALKCWSTDPSTHMISLESAYDGKTNVTANTYWTVYGRIK